MLPILGAMLPSAAAGLRPICVQCCASVCTSACACMERPSARLGSSGNTRAQDLEELPAAHVRPAEKRLVMMRMLLEKTFDSLALVHGYPPVMDRPGGLSYLVVVDEIYFVVESPDQVLRRYVACP